MQRLATGIGVVNNEPTCINKLAKYASKPIQYDQLNGVLHSPSSRVYVRLAKAGKDDVDGIIETKEDDAEFLWVNTGFIDSKTMCDVYMTFTYQHDRKLIGSFVGTMADLMLASFKTDCMGKYFVDKDGNKYPYTTKDGNPYLEGKARRVRRKETVPTTDNTESLTTVNTETTENTENKESIPTDKVTKQQETLAEEKFFNTIENKGTEESKPTVCDMSFELKSGDKEIYREIYENLLRNNGWTACNIESYIRICFQRLGILSKRGCDVSKYVAISPSDSHLVINTGFINYWGKEIFLRYRKNAFVISDATIITSKDMLEACGFDTELESKLEEIPVYDSEEDLIFPVTDIREFDMSDARIAHCVVDRIERFSEEYAKTSRMVRHNDMNNSVLLAIHLNKKDRGYVKPFYNIRDNKIQFLIPFIESGNSNEINTFVIVDKNKRGRWECKTVLPYKDAIKNIRVLQRYAPLW